jgi:hypothetical protein
MHLWWNSGQKKSRAAWRVTSNRSAAIEKRRCTKRESGRRRLDRDGRQGPPDRRHAEQLPGLVPDLVYLALMPYTGLVEVRRWASAAPGL